MEAMQRACHLADCMIPCPAAHLVVLHSVVPACSAQHRCLDGLEPCCVALEGLCAGVPGLTASPYPVDRHTHLEAGRITALTSGCAGHVAGPAKRLHPWGPHRQAGQEHPSQMALLCGCAGRVPGPARASRTPEPGAGAAEGGVGRAGAPAGRGAGGRRAGPGGAAGGAGGASSSLRSCSTPPEPGGQQGRARGQGTARLAAMQPASRAVGSSL